MMNKNTIRLELNRWKHFAATDLGRLEAALTILLENQRSVLTSELTGQTHDCTPTDRSEMRTEMAALSDLLDDLDYQRKWASYQPTEVVP